MGSIMRSTDLPARASPSGGTEMMSAGASAFRSAPTRSLRLDHVGQTVRSDTQSRPTKGPHRSGMHRAPRYRYTCYLRRVAGSCDAPSFPQDIVERHLLEVLKTTSLPEGISKDVDAAVAAILKGSRQNSRGPPSRRLAARLERLRDLYELGDVTREDYLRRRAELELQRAAAKEQGPTPSFVRQQEQLRTIIDDRGVITVNERRRLISMVLAEVRPTTTRV
jgi:hypothetical protein